MLLLLILTESYLVVYQSGSTRLCCSNKQVPIIRGLHSQGLISAYAMCAVVCRAPWYSFLCVLAQDYRLLSHWAPCAYTSLSKVKGGGRSGWKAKHQQLNVSPETDLRHFCSHFIDQRSLLIMSVFQAIGRCCPSYREGEPTLLLTGSGEDPRHEPPVIPLY